jgi:small subunit ribosomal protein S8
MVQIANMLNSIKNASHAGRPTVLVPYSQFKHAVARALHAEGYIAGFEKRPRTKGGDLLEITIKYRDDSTPRVSNLRLISKSSRRVYAGHSELHPVRQGYGHLFVSTPKGIMTSVASRKAHVGGEVLFEIW